MNSSSNATASNPANMPTPTPPTADLNTDDFGYETPTDPTPADPATPPVVDPATPPVVDPATPPADPKPIEGATGYEPSKEPATPPAEPPVTPPAEPAADSEEGKLKVAITEAVKSLGDGYNKEGITKFALEHKLNADQVKAWVTFQAAEDEKALKAHNEKIVAQREKWKKDLMADPEFIGEKGDQFDKSILKVNQLLESMPNTKKMLTDSKGMLPPYLMKDFLALARRLNPTHKFEGGNPPAPPEESENFLDDFYR